MNENNAIEMTDALTAHTRHEDRIAERELEIAAGQQTAELGYPRNAGWEITTGGNTTVTRNTTRPLYLVEFYTTNPKTGEGGWDINFAWMKAVSAAAAQKTLAAIQGRRFGSVISIDEHAEIVPLTGDFRCRTADANLFIYA